MVTAQYRHHRKRPAGQHPDAAGSGHGRSGLDESPLQVTHSFAGEPTEIVQARRLTSAQLDAWGVGADDRTALELVVTELFTNAVCHGRGPVGLRIAATGATLRIEVSDGGGGLPHLRPVVRSGSHIGGWGLRLVDELVQAWGSSVTTGRTLVWAERQIGPLSADP